MGGKQKRGCKTLDIKESEELKERQHRRLLSVNKGEKTQPDPIREEKKEEIGKKI